MSTAQFKQVAYGLTQALIPEMQLPIISQRNPTTMDKAQLGTLWVNTATNGTFILTSIVANVAHWSTSNGGTGISILTGDSGGPQSPLAGNVNIFGTAGEIVVTGTTNTLTLSLSGTIATSYVADTGTAIPAAGVLNVLGGASTAGINMHTTGSGNTLDIILNDSLFFPNTNTSGTMGVLNWGGARFIHNFGATNTFVGESAGNLTLTTANATENTGIGHAALASLVGSGSSLGDANSAVGNDSLTAVTDGSWNCALGNGSGFMVTTGMGNVLIGNEVAWNGVTGGGSTGLITGSNNILIGGTDNLGVDCAGFNYTGGESSNILLQSRGVTGESNVMRLGVNGSGAGQINSTFIAGITGVTVASSAAVLINTTTGQLGTVVSSRRYKENIEDMGDKSTAVLNLRPVNFTFRSDKTKELQWGLIAEEVDKTLPDLVIYNDEGQPESVRYHELPVLLLNEIKKLKKQIVHLQEKIK